MQNERRYARIAHRLHSRDNYRWTKDKPMTTFPDLQARLDQGQILILDGATGTELQRRGVPMHGFAWSAAALDTHPETVRAVHEDYIRAGADVIITNSFATARHVLEPAGLGDRVRALNQRAVTLAQAAREHAASGRPVRSEERRVGKECRWRWSPSEEEK